MKLFQRHSLRWRLTWQLLLFQAAILLCFIVALVIYVLSLDGRYVIVDPEITHVAARAIVRDDQGALTVRTTPELAELRAAVPNLWFIARSERGEFVQDGPVPEVYHDFGEQLERVHFAEIRDTVSPDLYSAVIRDAKGPAGRFTILGQGHL